MAEDKPTTVEMQRTLVMPAELPKPLPEFMMRDLPPDELAAALKQIKAGTYELPTPNADKLRDDYNALVEQAQAGGWKVVVNGEPFEAPAPVLELAQADEATAPMVAGEGSPDLAKTGEAPVAEVLERPDHPEPGVQLPTVDATTGEPVPPAKELGDFHEGQPGAPLEQPAPVADTPDTLVADGPTADTEPPAPQSTPPAT
jgi:hypothetical protein